MESPIVTITDGKVKGTQWTDFYGEKFHSFLGIPYAKPPIGELRFKAPEQIEPWNGIKDATKAGDPCYQRNEMLGHVGGSEDCLHLNVFTKKLPSEEKKLKPVMVWIHGGAFKSGSNNPNFYGPEFLMTEDVVLVTVNYRLGFLGFLHFNDTSLDVHGNAGLKDQQLALKWVQRNIRDFNGDPDNVTLFGESAGSMSVHYHVLSPTSKGLFHKAILQSGAVLNPWATCDDVALEFTKFVQPSIQTEKEALTFLRKLPVEELYTHQEKFYEEKSGGSSRIVGGNVEKPNPTAIITDYPAEALLKGQYNNVPILMGYCDREGMLFEVYKRNIIASGKPLPERYNSVNLDSVIHHDMNLDVDDPKRLLIKKKYLELYLQGKNAEDKHLLLSDYYFIAGMIGSAKVHAKNSKLPVYLYRVSLEAGLNVLKKLSKITDPGVCHGDELGYIFNINALSSNIGPVEKTAIKRFVKLWTNFAKFGNPTPKENDLNIEWKPVSGDEVNCLDIGTELTLVTNPEAERIKVWKEIFELSPATKDYL